MALLGNATTVREWYYDVDVVASCATNYLKRNIIYEFVTV